MIQRWGLLGTVIVALLLPLLGCGEDSKDDVSTASSGLAEACEVQGTPISGAAAITDDRECEAAAVVVEFTRITSPALCASFAIGAAREQCKAAASSPEPRDTVQEVSDVAPSEETDLGIEVTVNYVTGGSSSFIVTEDPEDGQLKVAGVADAGTPAATEAPVAPPPTEAYAVVLQITPFGDICKPSTFHGVAEELLAVAEDVGLSGARVVRADDYVSQDDGGWCVEYGRYATSAEANAGVAEVSSRLSDPKVDQDGQGASVEPLEVAQP